MSLAELSSQWLTPSPSPCRSGGVDTATGEGVDAPPAAGDVQQLEMTDGAGQGAVDQEVLSDRLQAQHRGQQQQGRTGRPGLGAAGGRVLDWVLGHGAGVAAEGLGEPTIEELRRLQDARGDPGRFGLEAIAAQPPGNKGIVEGPDRAVVVADRVVAALAHRQGPYPPTGEQPLAHELLRDGLSLGLVDDAAPEQMPVVRGKRVDSATVGIQRNREVLAVLDPEVAVEPPLEVGGLALES